MELNTHVCRRCEDGKLIFGKVVTVASDLSIVQDEHDGDGSGGMALNPMRIQWENMQLSTLSQVNLTNSSVYDKIFHEGDRVQRISDGRIGRIENIELLATASFIYNNSKFVISNIPLTRILPVSNIFPGVFVEYKGWIGRVENHKKELRLQFPDVSKTICKINHSVNIQDKFRKSPLPFRYSYLKPTAESESKKIPSCSYPYFKESFIHLPGQKMKLNYSQLKNANWNGFTSWKRRPFLLNWHFQRKEAELLSVEDGEVEIDWIFQYEGCEKKPEQVFDKNEINFLRILYMFPFQFIRENSIAMIKVTELDNLSITKEDEWNRTFLARLSGQEILESDSGEIEQNSDSDEMIPSKKSRFEYEGHPLPKTLLPVEVELLRHKLTVNWEDQSSSTIMASLVQTYSPNQLQSGQKYVIFKPYLYCPVRTAFGINLGCCGEDMVNIVWIYSQEGYDPPSDIEMNVSFEDKQSDVESEEDENVEEEEQSDAGDIDSDEESEETVDGEATEAVDVEPEGEEPSAGEDAQANAEGEESKKDDTDEQTPTNAEGEESHPEAQDVNAESKETNAGSKESEGDDTNKEGGEGNKAGEESKEKGNDDNDVGGEANAQGEESEDEDNDEEGVEVNDDKNEQPEEKERLEQQGSAHKLEKASSDVVEIMFRNEKDQTENSEQELSDKRFEFFYGETRRESIYNLQFHEEFNSFRVGDIVTKSESCLNEQFIIGVIEKIGFSGKILIRDGNKNTEFHFWPSEVKKVMVKHDEPSHEIRSLKLNTRTLEEVSESLRSRTNTLQDIDRHFLDKIAPLSHHFINEGFLDTLDDDAKTKFRNVVIRDYLIIENFLPPGVWLRGYVNRYDLHSLLVVGPPNTPFEDIIFTFDIFLPNNYPDALPRIHLNHMSNIPLSPYVKMDGSIDLTSLEPPLLDSPIPTNESNKIYTLRGVINVLYEAIFKPLPFVTLDTIIDDEDINQLTKIGKQNQSVVISSLDYCLQALSNPPEPWDLHIFGYYKENIPVIAETYSNWVINGPPFLLLPPTEGFTFALNRRLQILNQIIQTLNL